MNESLGNTAFLVAFILQWVIILTLCVMMVATLRHLSLMFDALDPIMKFRTNASPLHLNEPLPEIPLEEPGRGSFELRRLSGSFLFILLAQPSCQPCHEILKGARDELVGRHAVGWKSLVIVPGDGTAASGLREEHRLYGDVLVLADKAGGTSQPWGWGITGTPFALVVDGTGRVQRKMPSVTVEQVREVLCASPKDQIGRGVLKRERATVAYPSGGGRATAEGGDGV